MKVLILNKINLKKNLNLCLTKFIIYYFIYTASIIIFKIVKKLEKKYKLMIDHIESEAEIKLYEKLITLFKNEIY